MTAVRRIEVEVSEEVAEYLARRMATGGFADEGEVVRHALEEARDTDDARQREMREAVAAWRAAPDDTRAVDAVFDGLMERYRSRKNSTT